MGDEIILTGLAGREIVFATVKVSSFTRVSFIIIGPDFKLEKMEGQLFQTPHKLSHSRHCVINRVHRRGIRQPQIPFRAKP